MPAGLGVISAGFALPRDAGLETGAPSRPGASPPSAMRGAGVKPHREDWPAFPDRRAMRTVGVPARLHFHSNWASPVSALTWGSPQAASIRRR